MNKLQTKERKKPVCSVCHHLKKTTEGNANTKSKSNRSAPHYCKGPCKGFLICPLEDSDDRKLTYHKDYKVFLDQEEVIYLIRSKF